MYMQQIDFSHASRIAWARLPRRFKSVTFCFGIRNDFDISLSSLARVASQTGFRLRFLHVRTTTARRTSATPVAVRPLITFAESLEPVVVGSLELGVRLVGLVGELVEEEI